MRSRAHGARLEDVVSLVLWRALPLTVLGLGLGAALLLYGLLSAMLNEVSANDPITFTMVPLVLAAVAFAASYLPARRAGRVDPVVVLRHE